MPSSSMHLSQRGFMQQGVFAFAKNWQHGASAKTIWKWHAFIVVAGLYLSQMCACTTTLRACLVVDS